jgi:hypothetical protein
MKTKMTRMMKMGLAAGREVVLGGVGVCSVGSAPVASGVQHLYDGLPLLYHDVRSVPRTTLIERRQWLNRRRSWCFGMANSLEIVHGLALRVDGRRRPSVFEWLRWPLLVRGWRGRLVRGNRGRGKSIEGRNMVLFGC